MHEPSAADNSEDGEIASYEVSEDGLRWRPFDPDTDEGRLLHRRIEFAPPPPDRLT
jgi:hypothetical protein